MSKEAYKKLLSNLPDGDPYKKTLVEEIMTDKPKGGKSNEALDRFAKGLPSFPIWCTSDMVPLTRETLDIHYYRRNKLLMTLIDKPVDKSKAKQYEFLSDFWNYLYINEDCLCGLAESNGETANGRLKNIKLFGEGKVGQAFLIREMSTGKNFILKGIKKINTSFPRVKGYKVQKGETNPIVLGSMIETQTLDNFVFLTAGMTTFANQTVMHMLMNLLLSESLNYVYQHDAFICKDNGYNIMETASEGDMSNYINSQDWSDKDLITICDQSILQLFPALAFLKRKGIAFCHNDLKAKNVFVNKENGHVVYKLADFDKSSITFRGVRFYNGDNGEAFVNNYVDIPEGAETVTLQESYMSKITHAYEGTISNAFIMFNPYGYYLTQDFYTFVLSLIFEKKINSVIKTGKFNSENSIFIKIIEIMDTFSKGAIRKFIASPPKNGESLTVINGVMHSNKLTILTSVDNLMEMIGLRPIKTDTEFLKVIDTKRKILIGDNGGVCISAPKLKKGYFTKTISCDTLPYGMKTGKHTWDYLRETKEDILISEYGVTTV